LLDLAIENFEQQFSSVDVEFLQGFDIVQTIRSLLETALET